MSSRREFLAAAGVAALPVMASGRDGVPRPERPELALAIVDLRLPQSRLVGNELSRRGVPVQTFDGDDITALWLDDVQPLWRSSRAAVGGLTARIPLFCLEQLAWSFGLRVIYHAEHLIRADGSAVHAAQTAGVAPRGPMWPARVAERLAAHRSSACVRGGPSCAPLEPAVAADARLLHSWIIASI